MIYANKQDVKGSMNATEITQHLNLTSIKDHGWHIQACCALTGEGLVEIYNSGCLFIFTMTSKLGCGDFIYTL